MEFNGVFYDRMKHDLFGYGDWESIIPNKRYSNPFSIKDVIFNNPAVIVLWADGTKTVVKCSENDIFDPEKGLAMAISKKALGNQGNYYETFKKYLPEEEDIDDFGLHPEVTLLEDIVAELTAFKNSKDSKEPHSCTNCEHLCQSLHEDPCYDCDGSRNKWKPAK